MPIKPLTDKLIYANVQKVRKQVNPQRSPHAYGKRLPTRWEVFDGKRWRKVFAICFSNAATYYIRVKKEVQFVRDADLEAVV
jgi:hypothetical protein